MDIGISTENVNDEGEDKSKLNIYPTTINNAVITFKIIERRRKTRKFFDAGFFKYQFFISRSYIALKMTYGMINIRNNEIAAGIKISKNAIIKNDGGTLDGRAIVPILGKSIIFKTSKIEEIII